MEKSRYKINLNKAKLMARFFWGGSLDQTNELTVSKNLWQHIKALRINPGEIITLFNGNGFDYRARLETIDKKTAILKLMDKIAVFTESPLFTILIQAYSTSQKLDWVVQKAVELGVNEIYPVISERSQIRHSGKSDHKHQRWQEICHSALEQSHRAHLPLIHPITALKEVLPKIDSDIKWLLHPGSGILPGKNKTPKSAALLIGPEGGFSDCELAFAHNYGFTCHALGPRIMRTETAPIAALTLLQSRYGDFI
jgi:RNA methyltransferase, rsmE family